MDSSGQGQYFRGHVANLGTGSTAILTVPATMSGLIASVWVHNPTGGAITVTLYHGSDELHSESIAAGASAQYTPDIVLTNGEALNAKGSSAGLNVWAMADLAYLRN